MIDITLAEPTFTIWNWLTYIILFTVLTISMYTDWKYHKIYNWVTYPAIILGFIINTINYGSDGFISCCINLGITLLFFGIFYLLKMMGAGDIKLIIAISCLMNAVYAFAGLIIGTILAGIYGMYVWFKTKNRKLRIQYGIFIGVGFYLYQILLYLTGY